MKRAVLTASGLACGVAATIIIRNGSAMEILGLAIVSLSLSLASAVLPTLGQRAQDGEARRG